ncbi:MAG: potassium-transporting ATPase subunit F [Verrucomicrobiaceae bacterium]|nr:MAG: potassium-transporting ATPase subunit F [Verrucomicrobiaceae bacterium]
MSEQVSAFLIFNPSTGMETILLSLTALFLFLYLITAMVWPEKF